MSVGKEEDIGEEKKVEEVMDSLKANKGI